MFVMTNMEILHKVLSVFDHHLLVPDTSLHPRDDLHPNPYNDVKRSYLHLQVL